MCIDVSLSNFMRPGQAALPWVYSGFSLRLLESIVIGSVFLGSLGEYKCGVLMAVSITTQEQRDSCGDVYIKIILVESHITII